MVRRNIVLLVFAVLAIAARAQDGEAKPEKAVSPLTQAPFDAFAGVWRRVEIERPNPSVLDDDDRYETVLRIVNLNPKWHSLLIEHVYRRNPSDGDSVHFGHHYFDRLIWNSDEGRIVTGSYRDGDEVKIDPDSGKFVTEYDGWRGANERSTNVCDGQTWTVRNESQAYGTDQWVLRSIERFERVTLNPDLTKGLLKSEDKRELWLEITTLPSGSIRNYRLDGNVLQYEYCFGGSGYARLAARLTDEQVESIWELLESMKFRQWDRKYINRGIMDGSHFEFRVVDGRKSYAVTGSNKAPQDPGSDADEVGLGLIAVLQAELVRQIAEANDFSFVPGWTREPTLKK